MKHSKTCPILIILILSFLTILLVFNPGVLAASNPSVPQFTLQYVDHSYDIPPTYGTDPYTGNTIMKTYGSHVDNRTIDVTIMNQPFTPYKDSSNNTIQLYYNVRSKGHFEEWNGDSDFGSHSVRGLQASSSTYTVISFDIQYWGVSAGGQIDFQVEAITGYAYYDASACGTNYQTTVGNSGWSSIQTITIGNPANVSSTTPPISTPNLPTFNPYNPTVTPSPSQNPTSTPILPGAQTGGLFGFVWVQTALIVMAIVIAVLVVALVSVTWRRSATE
jgi:hypothetical protein